MLHQVIYNFNFLISYFLFKPPKLSQLFQFVLLQFVISQFLQHRLVKYKKVIVCKFMDLPYPSRKDVTVDSQLNKIDKIYSKLMLSVKDIKQQETLSKWTRDKIQKFIEQDDITKLEKYLQKHAIFYDRQIGAKSLKWNVIHFCAKYNSVNSLRFILCKIYQEDRQQYIKLINQKTFQGYTPLMITVISHSYEAMQILLHFGGIDIYQIDCKKMTAYEMSLNYNNQVAIKCLIQYQKKYKKKVSINQKQLLKPTQIQSIMKVRCYESLMQQIVNCFICFKFQDEPSQSKAKSYRIQNQKQKRQNKQENFIMKSLNNSILKNIWGPAQEKIDKVSIGREDLMSQYDICWKKMSQLNNQKRNLFQSFQPFDICQNNFVIFNNLILFQCLSDHAWLLRKIIKTKSSQSENMEKSKSKACNEAIQYIVRIYQNNVSKKIVVDQFIPFLKEREQAMFLSNSNQLWPMVLQKALAKCYGSYMALAEIRPIKIVQDLTGFLTKKFQLSQKSNSMKIGEKTYKQKSIISILQQFTTKGYLILLQGRQGTSLSPKQKSKTPYCYTILNYYQKGDNKMILINCSYVLQQWKQKQKTQMMQLKLIKSHYNKHNQMCVWIQQSQFCYFFKNVIVSFIQANYQRTELKLKISKQIDFQQKISTLDMNSCVVSSQISDKIEPEKSLINQASQAQSKIKEQGKSKETKTIFIKFNIEKDKSQPVIFMLKNVHKSIQTKIIKYEAWVNEGNQIAPTYQNDLYTPELMKFVSKKGEYLLKVEFQSSFKNFQRKSRKQSFNKENSLAFINMSSQNKGKANNNFDSQKDIPKNVQASILEKSNQFIMICWSQQLIQLEFIEEQFAKLEWIQSWKRYMTRNWSQKSSTAILTLLGKSIILAKGLCKETNLVLKLKNTQNQISQKNVLQGQFTIDQQSSIMIKMIKQQKGPYLSYIVLSNVPMNSLERQNLQIFQEDLVEKKLTKLSI